MPANLYCQSIVLSHLKYILNFLCIYIFICTKLMRVHTHTHTHTIYIRIHMYYVVDSHFPHYERNFINSAYHLSSFLPRFSPRFLFLTLPRQSLLLIRCSHTPIDPEYNFYITESPTSRDFREAQRASRTCRRELTRECRSQFHTESKRQLPRTPTRIVVLARSDVSLRIYFIWHAHAVLKPRTLETTRFIFTSCKIIDWSQVKRWNAAH